MASPYTANLPVGSRDRSDLTVLPATAPVEEMHAVIARDGALVVQNLLDEATVAALNQELDPVMSGPQLGVQYGEVVGNTRRLNATLRHSPTAASKVVAHPVLVGVAESFMLRHADTMQLAAAHVAQLAPGEPAQLLHRDDWNWGHVSGRSHPLSIFSIIALSEFTAAAGATRAIPGSHRWTDAYAASTNRECWRNGVYEELSYPDGLYDHLAIPAELEPGSALMALGTTAHGAGLNATTDVFRRALQIKFCMGWLRPTTNNFLLYPPEFARTLPETVQRLLGYQLEAKHCGQLEQGEDPIVLLRELTAG